MRRLICLLPHPSFHTNSILISVKRGRNGFQRGIAIVASLLLPAGTISTTPADPNTSWISQSARPAVGINSRVQGGQGGMILEQGKSIERELGGNEKHSYRITLTEGQFLRAVFDQRGINLIITLYGPDGGKIAELDSPVGSQGPEPVSLIAETSGSYRLEVQAWQKSAPKGLYEVRIEDLRAAAPQDKIRVAAERAFAEATLVSGQGTAESLRKAIEKYRETIPLWQALGDRQQEVYGLTVIGSTHGDLSEYQQALDYYTQALELSRVAKDRKGEGMALYSMGLVYNVLGEHQKALDFYDLALQIHLATGDRSREAATLGNIGAVYSNLGEQQKALEFFNRALPLKRAVGDHSGEATLLNNIGFIYDSLGEPGKAMDFYNTALPILQAIGDRRGEATTLNNIGMIYDLSGEYQKALDLYNQVVQIKRSVGNTAEEAIALNNIGLVYDKLGEYQKALDTLNQALLKKRAAGVRSGEAVTIGNIGQVYNRLGDYPNAVDYNGQALLILREIGDRRGQAIALNNIAHASSKLGDKKKALDCYYESLALRRATNDRRGEAITLDHIGSIYQDLGETQKAFDHSSQSLATFRDIGDRPRQAVALSNIASIYKKLGDNQKAIDYFNQALALVQYTGSRSEEALALYNIAVIERDRGNLIEASNYIDKTLAAIESLRTQVVSPRLRASFFASMQKYYEFDIGVLMRLHKQSPSAGFDAAALKVSERLRARSLLEMLKEAGAEIRQGVDRELIEREHQLRQAIASKAERQMRLLSGRRTEEQATAVAKEIDALATEYEQLQARIRQTSPRYAALTQPAPLGLSEIQTEVLDDETLLLEYALGEEKSFLWAVTPASIKSFELPGRAEIEAAARRLYNLLTARDQSVPKETPAQSRRRLELAEAEYPRASAILSQMLLGPAAAELAAKRLLIVSEGALQYVPFAALPVPESGRVGEKKSTIRNPQSAIKESAIRNPQSFTPLVFEHEVISLPSASVLAVLRREMAGRQPAAQVIGVLADPVFEKDDERFKAVPHKAEGAQTESNTDETKLRILKHVAKPSDGKDGSRLRVQRLRFSRQEAEGIFALAPEGKRMKALDFKANRTTATSAEIGHYQFVHFATHGYLDSERPELSALVLALVDEQGRSQDGFLRLYDIYNMKLRADLVVLSACQTALGQEVRGEGLIGLTRGFMYAGAPRVVASLWLVDDRVTAELMRRFYRGVLGEGLRPSAALRATQISMWKDKRWAAPHYWAAFTLQGEWK